MVYMTKLSTKHQIVIPRDARRQLSLAPGDRLLIEVRDGALILTPRPQSYARHLRGLHREVWRDVDPLKYVQEERKGWR